MERCYDGSYSHNKEELVGNVKLKDSLDYSAHEMVEFKLPRATRRMHSKLATLDFQREDFWPLQGHAW